MVKKNNINKPKWSKINWTAGATFIAAVAVALGMPEEYREVAFLGLSTVPPVLIAVFRTFFTEAEG